MTINRPTPLPQLAAAIDSSDEGIELFRRAAEIAASLNMALETTVLTDINLEHMAALPFGRTYALATGTSRAFDREALSDLARTQARRIRLAHDEVRQRFHISCTTTNRRSTSAAATIARLTSVNRYVIARAPLHATEVVRPRRGAPPAKPGHTALIVLGSDPTARQEDLATGLRIATVLGWRLLVLAPQALRGAVDGQLRERARAVSAPPVTVDYAVGASRDDMCASAGRYRVDLVIAPVEVTGHTEQEMHHVLREVGCPVLLINRDQSAPTAAERLTGLDSGH